MNAGRIAWSIVGLLSVSVEARAGPVTWEFAGEVTRIVDPDNLLNGQVVIGSELQGSFTFESTTPDSQPHPSGGRYQDAVTLLEATLGNLTVHGPTHPPLGRNTIDVDDSDTFDLYFVDVPVEFLGYNFFQWTLLISDTNGELFETDALPLIPPDIVSFRHLLSVRDRTENIPLGIEVQLHSLVPEPSTLVFLTLGVATCLYRRRIGQTSRKPNGSIAVLGLLALLVTTIDSNASDCNRNGLDDAQELALACKIDVVALFDTSPSMTRASAH